jgi:hypothetical protein
MYQDDKLAKAGDQAALAQQMTDQLTQRVENILADAPEEVAEITPQQMAQAIIEIKGALQDIAQQQFEIKQQLQVMGAGSVYNTSP